MKVKSLENKLKKLGYEIKQDAHWANNILYYVESKTRNLSWYVQGDDVCCLNSRGIDDHSDSRIDYFAGFYPRTIKLAIDSLDW